MVRSAKISDLPGINSLLEFYELSPIDESYFLGVCFVSEMHGEIVGFIWAGLMNGDKLAYLDYLTIAPIAKGDGPRLAEAMLSELKSRGVRQGISCIELNGSEHSDQALRINRHFGMRKHESEFALLLGDVAEAYARWVV